MEQRRRRRLCDGHELDAQRARGRTGRHVRRCSGRQRDVLLMYTYAGDLNLDGLIDGADYGVIDNYVQFPGTSGYSNGDINCDGMIDGADYGLIDNAIQLQGAPFQAGTYPAVAGALTPVPEPASPSIIGFASASILGPRSRRSRRAARRERH